MPFTVEIVTDMPEEATEEAGVILSFALSHKEIPLMNGLNRAWCWKEKFLLTTSKQKISR